MVILLEASFLDRNDFFTEVIFFLLLYIDSNFGSTRKHYYYIHLGFSTIYNEEPPFESLECSKSLYLLGSKLSLDLYPLIFIYASSVVELN